MTGTKQSSSAEEEASSSYLTAMVLVVPGVILYAYTLYIMLSKLVYPASFLPFTEHTSLMEANSSEHHELGVRHPLVWDALLLMLFALQHSIMACDGLKGFFEDIGLPVLSRPVYICFTCFTINTIHHFWLSYSSETLWQWDSRSLTLLLLVAHLLGWLSIACSLFSIDYLELLGIKQIYYSFYGFDNPMLYKSEEQQRLLCHNRHPILLAPTLILWAVPVMTYDRLLVALMLPLYLGLANSVDNMDVAYVSEQFAVKKLHLLENNDRDRQ